MEFAIIADVHSNLPALTSVLEDAGDLEVFSLGDVIGYYPFPNETVEMLRQREVKSIMGNHDYAVVKGETAHFNQAAAASIRWTIDVLSKDNFRFLQALEKSHKTRRFTAFHGSPRNPLFEYVYPNLSDQAMESYLGDAETLILAHTHVPYVKRLEKGLIFNPGSVGQPRDGNPKACYAVFDPEGKKVTIKRVNYDIDTVAERTKEAGLPSEFAERLKSGL
jgi:putative phosphoesterase